VPWKAEAKPIDVPPTVIGDWTRNADGSWLYKGQPTTVGKFLNEVFDDLWRHADSQGKIRLPGGRFADVRTLSNPDGSESGYVSKTFGQRRNWHYNEDTRTYYREDWPMVTPDPLHQQRAARKMVETTVHGAAVAQQCDVPVLDIVGYDVSGPTPSYIQREINKHLDKVPPTKDGGKVVEEVLGDKIPLGPGPEFNLPEEYAEAMAVALEKLWRNGAVMQDIQPANFFFRRIEFPDGRPPRIEAGISDPDRIDWFKNPRKYGGIDGFLESIEADPHGKGVKSRDAGGGTINTAEEAMLVFMEQMKPLNFSRDQFDAFTTQVIPFHILKRHFDNLEQFPGQSSDLSPSIHNVVPFPGHTDPRRRLAGHSLHSVAYSWRMAA
jgi:hypothetical protein